MGFMCVITHRLNDEPDFSFLFSHNKLTKRIINQSFGNAFLIEDLFL